MSSRHKVLTLVVLVLALLTLAAVPAGSEPRLYAWSDGVSTSKDDLANQAEQVRSNCVKKPVAIKKMSLTKALAQIKTSLKKKESPLALKAFTKSADARTVGKAGGAAFGAVAAGKPWAAVDALLRVHELDKRNAVPLIDLAGIVTAQGMPKEGLALLDAAAKLHTKGSAPMGISWNALALNNRGYALLMLGHLKEAKPLLVKAEQAEPLLSEARQNLDAADQCTWAAGGGHGDPPVIADPPFWRESKSSDITTNDKGDPIPVASSFLDLSQGTEWQPVLVRIPDSPEQGSTMGDYYTNTQATISNEIIANSTKAAGLKSAPSNSLTDQRTQAIWNALNTAHWQPDLKPLYKAYDDLYLALSSDSNAGFGAILDPAKPLTESYDECIPKGAEYEACMHAVCTEKTASLQASWKPRMAAVNDADLRWEAAYWRYATAVAANVLDPAQHQRMLLDARSQMLAERYNVLMLAANWVYLADEGVASEFCLGPPPTAPAAGTLPNQDDSKACPPSLKGVKVAFKVSDVFKFSVACEKIEFEIATKGWLGAFANVSYNPKSGQTTVFTGGKMSGGGATGKVGGFMTIGRDGSPIDGGIRVSGSMEVGAGGASISRSNTLDLGVAGAVNWPR
ncbi:MAG TPA: hypothetical protein VII83_01305 [Gaiellaceae bacterium]